VLEARLLYPIHNTAAAHSSVYTANISKTNQIEAKYPPLNKSSMALGSGYFTMICPDPMSWATVLGILAALELLAKLGWTVVYRVFIPTFAIWVSFTMVQQPWLGDLMDWRPLDGILVILCFVVAMAAGSRGQGRVPADMGNDRQNQIPEP